MMTTQALTSALAGVFVPMGIAGAALGVLCAIVALVAVTAGRVGLIGGAVGVWIVGAMLSIASGFAGDWRPAVVAVAALAAALVLGAVLRPSARLLAARMRPDAAPGAPSPAALSPVE